MRDYSKLNYHDFQISEAIDRVIVGKNADRNRIILRLALLYGYTYEQIDDWLRCNENLPKHYKIQVQQIGRVVRSGETKVFNHLRRAAKDN